MTRPPRAVLVSSNGTGMGHLTRLLAYARHLDGVDVRFLSLSLAAPVVRQMGYPVEYLPSQGATGLRSATWRRMFEDRLREYVLRVRPDVVVFDGTFPYPGFETVRAATPGVRWLWSRRGMWKPGLHTSQIDKSSWFDRVIEPGDLAGAVDVGATAGPRDRGEVSLVRPVTLLDLPDLSSRAEARAALGLPAEGALALVSLGSGVLWDAQAAATSVAAQLAERGVGTCMTQTALVARLREQTHAADLHVVRDYPLSRRLAAFDLAVVVTGYNAFHEHLRLGLPSLFVPNIDIPLDDQAARARYAEQQGWAHVAQTHELDDVRDRLGDLLERGATMAAQAQAADPGNGAADAATIIREELAS